MEDALLQVTGGCYCGRVRYRAGDVNRDVIECHCSQCRKQSGHRYAGTFAKTADVEIEGDRNITWFRASPDAERGFCSVCGSHMFWKQSNGDYMGILAASVDEPSGLTMARHIFVDNKGDYYDITDDLPRFPGSDQPPPSDEL